MPSYTRIWHRPLKISSILLGRGRNPKKRKNLGKPKKNKDTHKKNSSRLFGEGGLDKSFVFFVFQCVFLFLGFSNVFFLFFLCSYVFLPAAPFGLPHSQGPCFFLSKECHQRNKTRWHFFQGNLHKGMPHCPQGMQWFLEVQLLIEEYLFNIYNAWLSARNIILVQMTIPWSHTALSYRNITLFLRDCYTHIYEKVPFRTRT